MTNSNTKKDSKIALIFDLPLASTTEKGVITEIAEGLSKGDRLFIATPNPEFIVFAQKHPWFKKCLSQAHINLPDGIGLVLASKLLLGIGRGIKNRIPGVDFMDHLCAWAAETNHTVYLIGGVEGRAQQAFDQLKVKYPKLLGWTEVGPKLTLDPNTGLWDENSRRELTESLVSINNKNPDILFVALGMGKQEKFICDLWPDLKVGMAIGVGGAFNYLSGQVKRAPDWIRKLGLEWAYRLFKEPWRARRQTALLEFIKITLQTKFART